MTHVKDIMKGKIITVDHNESIRQACDKYKEHKVGSLIVTDKSDILGIVTERDFIERTICMDKNPKTTKVKDIMSTEVMSIDINETIMKAVDIMKDKNIKKLPVTSNGALVGIITSTDIAYSRPSLKHFFNE